MRERKSSLIEKAGSLGLDASGTKKELAKRIIENGGV